MQVQFRAQAESELIPELTITSTDTIRYKTQRGSNPNRPRDAAILYPLLIARPLNYVLVPTKWEQLSGWGGRGRPNTALAH